MAAIHSGLLAHDLSINRDAGSVLALALQADGQVLVGGDFTTMGAATRNRVARLQNDAATQLLSVPSSDRVQWLRGGGLPEVATVTFQASIDGGLNYITLGEGSRIPGGWESLPALGTLPARGQLRALARSALRSLNGSSGPPPVVATSPVP